MPRTDNGFMLFAEHIRPQLEQIQGGRHLPKEELVSSAAPYWEDLPDDDRKLWKEESKQCKSSIARDPVPKKKKKKKVVAEPQLTFLSEQRAQAARTYFDETDTENFEQQRKRQLKKLIEHFDWMVPRSQADAEDREALRALMDVEHHILSVLPYLESETHEFVPAEISLLVCSLSGGIRRERTWIVALPDDLELNKVTRQNMEDRAQTVTGIPLTDQVQALKGHRFCVDYNSLAHHLHKYTKTAKFYFMSSQQYNQVQGCMYFMRKTRENALMRRTNSVSKDQMFCVEDLAAALAAFKLRSLSPSVAQIQMVFQSAPVQAGCTFHKKTPHLQCALSTARMAWFGLWKALEPIYGCQPTSKSILTPIQEQCEATTTQRKPRTLPPSVHTRQHMAKEKDQHGDSRDDGKTDGSIEKSDMVELEAALQEIEREADVEGFGACEVESSAEGKQEGSALVDVVQEGWTARPEQGGQGRVGEEEVGGSLGDCMEMGNASDGLEELEAFLQQTEQEPPGPSHSHLQIQNIRDERFFMSLTDENFEYKCRGLGRGWIRSNTRPRPTDMTVSENVDCLQLLLDCGLRCAHLRKPGTTTPE